MADIKGNPVYLDSFRGNPVIIRFFVTDCKYCKADTSVFNEYFNKHKEDGLQILYITTTADHKLVSNFSDDLQIPFPVIIDQDAIVSKLYNIKIVPQTIILSPDHKIVSAILGGVGKAELEELVGIYFNKQQ
ncbi:MAG: TlpA family protein disulfide reductase [Proteobacteria bacterium]|nr:TlpA family protein disulfide reductase [Pseudomonadota bacterium]MBU1714762.1 TlpA family protein disulfide reductase [Pseudomonadota bacterium]